MLAVCISVESEDFLGGEMVILSAFIRDLFFWISLTTNYAVLFIVSSHILSSVILLLQGFWHAR